MKNTFITDNSVSIEESQRVIAKLNEDFETLVSGKVTESEAFDYCLVLAKQSICLRPESDMIFWPARTDSDMPADARVEFIYQPTYLACGMMMFAKLHYKGIEASKMLDSTLEHGLNGCMAREFMGHGYESVEGFINTMRIFGKAKAMRFVQRFPNVNPRFATMLKMSIEYLENEVCTGKSFDWGSPEDLATKAKSVLELYRE